jgi:hypothetical protein
VCWRNLSELELLMLNESGRPLLVVPLLLRDMLRQTVVLLLRLMLLLLVILVSHHIEGCFSGRGHHGQM